MPRKGEVPKRDSLPDPKYTEAPIDVRKRVTKFMNTVMTRGKKSTLEQIDVVGNVRVKEAAVRTALGLRVGDPYGQTKLLAGKRRIGSLSGVSKVEIASMHGSTDDRVKLQIEISE